MSEITEGGTKVLVNPLQDWFVGKRLGVVKESPYSLKKAQNFDNLRAFLKQRKDIMSLETKIIKLKMKYDKLARREPMSGQQVLDRIIWERLKRILVKRYGRYD